MRDCYKCINEGHCFWPYDENTCPNYLERVTPPQVDQENLEKLLKMPEVDVEGYQSPIEIIYDKLIADFNTQLENNVITAVQNYGINVDRDELIKALNYDRGQYEAGYRTAMLRYKAPRGEWIKKAKRYDERAMRIYAEFECSVCGARHTFPEIPETNDAYYQFDFCPSCGADMREEGES